MKYATIAALSACLVLSGLAWWYQARAASLAAENEILRGKLATCDVRLQNINEARRDVETVNDWGSLINIPDGWLLPPIGAGD